MMGSFLFGALMNVVGPMMQIIDNAYKQAKEKSKRLWDYIAIPLFFSSTLVWDTWSYLTIQPSKDEGKNKRASVPRSILRKRLAGRDAFKQNMLVSFPS
jgi:hypothetical protein